jgi:Tol biopolymer transport system component
LKKNIVLGRIIIIGCAIFIISCENGNTGPEIEVTYPVFTDEIEVIIDGYNRNAMEPFVSKDGSFLFFNSLNDGDSTSLYYATRLNDTVFNFEGEIEGVNGQVPHLDAVASMDINNDFYFVSTRNYPDVFENYQTGEFDNGVVTGIESVMGDFYIYEPGWLIMDAEISRNGDLLYYVNAKFSGNPLPDEARLGVAVRKNSIFEKLDDSEDIFRNINNFGCLVYAPCISSDGNEIYFTRIIKGTFTTQICVSVRSGTGVTFSVPRILEIEGISVEAPSLAEDGERLYYHKKLENDNKYHIFTMRRE